MHEMRTVATDVPVAWYVYMLRACAVQKPLHGSMFCLVWRLMGVEGSRSTADSMRPSPSYFSYLL